MSAKSLFVALFLCATVALAQPGGPYNQPPTGGVTGLNSCSNIADNVILRGDETNKCQGSALTVADTTGNLTGPSGGFSIIGGTAATDDLTLDGSAGTAGNVTVTENGRLVLVTNGTSENVLDLSSSTSANDRVTVKVGNNSSTGSLFFYDKAGTNYANLYGRFFYPSRISFDNDYGLRLGSADCVYFGSTTNGIDNVETCFGRESAGVLKIRRGTSPTGLDIYGTWANSGTDVERLSLSCDGTADCTIATETAGTGSDDMGLTLLMAGTGDLLLEDVGANRPALKFGSAAGAPMIYRNGAGLNIQGNDGTYSATYVKSGGFQDDSSYSDNTFSNGLQIGNGEDVVFSNGSDYARGITSGGTNAIKISNGSTGWADLVMQDNIEFEGSADDTNETQLAVTNPTADQTITLPDATGTVQLVSYGGLYLSSAGGTAFVVDTDTGTFEIFPTFTVGTCSSDVTCADATDDITMTRAGVYQANFSCSFTAGNSDAWVFKLYEEGVAQDHCVFSRTMGAVAAIGSASFNCIVTAAVNDSYAIYGNNASDGDDATLHYCNLTMTRVGN